MVKIAAFGGSAGSFEVFREILPRLPQGVGAAYVFVTHLPRTHVSEIPKLFSRHTTMEVLCADSAREVQPDTVYVLAPHTFLYMRKEGLVPEHRPASVPNRAINHFFQSLCASQRENAIGILLSGGGYDGKDGCECIRAHGGITIAQEPESAKFPTMPKHAINAGVISEVLPPEAIPIRLAQLLRPEESLSRVS